MKTLSDGNQVTSRSYYFLLDWNEQNRWYFINEKFNKERLCDLTKDEYIILWLYATTNEYNIMVANPMTHKDAAKECLDALDKATEQPSDKDIFLEAKRVRKEIKLKTIPFDIISFQMGAEYMRDGKIHISNK